MTSSDGNLVSYRGIRADQRSPEYERFARRLRREVAGKGTFHCLVTTDAELRRLNRDFLDHDYPTDVLSFPSGGGGELGDLAISLTRARAQAREYGHTVHMEVRVLMLHGILHLLGMDHAADGGKMARAEKRWRTRLKLPGGLIERSQA